MNENVSGNGSQAVADYYHDKGFWDADIIITQSADTSFENGAKLNIAINKGEKIKVGEIVIDGVANLETKQVLRSMKDLKAKKWYRIFKSSKFVEANLDQAHDEIIALYNKEGYRNARVLGDSIYRLPEGLVGVKSMSAKVTASILVRFRSPETPSIAAPNSIPFWASSAVIRMIWSASKRVSLWIRKEWI